VEAVKGMEIPTGLSVDEATRRADVALRRIYGGNEPTFDSTNGPDFADELHAICRVIAQADDPSEGRLQYVTSLYQAVKELSWPEEDLDEKTGLLTRISYLAWLDARRRGTYSELVTWEERSVGHALEQESVEAFVALRAETRSDELNRRFFHDPAVLLAAITRLRRMIDLEPLLCLSGVVSMQSWLSQNWQGLPSREESAYFAAELSWILAAASRLCGRYRECENWLDRLDENSGEVLGAESLQARSRYLRLAVLHSRRLYEGVLEQLPALRETFLRLGMRLYVAKSCLLRAVTLKEIGRDAEARLEFEALTHDPELQDRQVRGLAFIGLAELDGRLGRFDLAMSNLSTAGALVQEEGMPIAVGHLHGIRGELLRDQGLLLAAVDSYRAATAVYLKAGMESFAAYVRIVLAETLLAAGREDQAAREIVAALPTIAERQLVHEAMAAMVLLRESLRRQKIDPSALRELREQLDRMRKDGEL
jgi:tetratricopeptide (TPR) repeat protein